MLKWRMPARPALARTQHFHRRVMPPRIPADVVDRPRLTGLAELLARKRLTLVHAPAGSGKTTLLSQWYAAVRSESCVTAWYSASDDEKDPLGLADYLGLVIGAAAGAEEPNGLPINREEALTRLVDLVERVAAGQPLVLFVDDYHLVDERDGRATIEALLAADFPHLGIVIASRLRPSLTLGRYRAYGEMIEITGADLQFSARETLDFFRSARGIELSEDEGTAVRRHTEGWAAGLRLASLVLGQDGRQALIAAAPPGSHRAFADYFLEEVISGLPEHVIGFLTDTCILESLNAGLCDQVTGRGDSAEILAALETAQLFIVSLPGQQSWYRYHHLFQEFLRNRLFSAPGGAEKAEALHLGAAGWFLAAGSPVEAVRHAFLGRRPRWAAEIIERHCVFDYLSHGRFELYYRWMQQLPREAREERPLLMFLLVWRDINSRRFHQAEQNLVAIEEGYARPDGVCRAIVAETGLDLSGRLHLMRALIGAYGSDLAACRAHIDAIGGAELDKLAFGQVDLDSIHSYLLYLEGDLETAERLTWKANGIYDQMACYWGGIHSRCIAAMCYLARGLGREAASVAADALAIGERNFSQQSYMVALPSALLGEIAFRDGDLARAEALWLRAMPVASETDVFGMGERVLIPTTGLARLYDLTGRSHEADALLVRISRHAYETEDVRLEVELALERIDRAFRLDRKAAGWRELERLEPLVAEARRRFPPAIWRIWERHDLVAAQRLAAEERPAEAARLLDGVAARARAEGRLAVALPYAAFAAELAGRAEGGLAAAAARRRAIGGEARALGLEGMIGRFLEPEPSGVVAPPEPRPEDAFTLAPLTPRETAVLELVQRGLTNQAIAARLGINLNTVKSHVKNIFEKLGVRSRTQAVLKTMAR